MLAIKTLPHESVIFRREMLLMGMRFEISIVSKDLQWANERVEDAVKEINRVEKLISAFNDDSTVNEINRNAGIGPVKTNAEIFRLIDRSMKISELTYGTFDITYFTVDKEHENNCRNGANKITRTELNYKNIVLDAKTQTVFLRDKNMRIGFGANSKGYAADRAKYILQMNGVGSGIINAGGDIITWGLQPNNEPWTVAAADPEQVNLPFASIPLSNLAIATSINNKKHTAAISEKISDAGAATSRKGFPVSDIKSVSIISTSAELADSLSATVMLMGINAGLYLINQLNQVACVIVDDYNRVYTSKGVLAGY
jgi:thiamine biosynthesis lipoprotein